mmetsp:Transcript_17149/g.33949  ORF Transcript_17149/g.33949 Transcript_17149/m.33949 type:complete len:216 (-) Transcript_17149:407-1054(-)
MPSRHHPTSPFHAPLSLRRPRGFFLQQIVHDNVDGAVVPKKVVQLYRARGPNARHRPSRKVRVLVVKRKAVRWPHLIEELLLLRLLLRDWVRRRSRRRGTAAPPRPPFSVPGLVKLVVHRGRQARGSVGVARLLLLLLPAAAAAVALPFLFGANDAVHGPVQRENHVGGGCRLVEGTCPLRRVRHGRVSLGCRQSSCRLGLDHGVGWLLRQIAFP